MKDRGRLLWLFVGVVLGAAGAACWLARTSPVLAAATDRHEDFIMCTGAVSTHPRAPTEGVWLLDYKTGRLLGTVVDRGQGKIAGWAELDLTAEFNLAPPANVRFLLATGQIAQGQSALYVAETTSGKFGVYTMGQRPDGQNGFAIRRHDLVLFRPQPKE